MQREAELTQNEKLLKEAQRVKETELLIGSQADVTIAITQDEQQRLHQEKLSNVVIIPNVHEAEHSGDETPGFESRSGLLFIGGYLHKPNIDAAEWLVKEIMPLIWRDDPSIKLTLLGSNPTQEILSYQSENITVTGYVKDVAPYFNKNRVFVAPLRYGAGMKGKIGQSLEFGLPAVSTDIGVEGMNLVDEHHIIVANTTQDFASKTLLLYKNPELWNNIQSNAGDALRQYTPENVTLSLKALFESLSLQPEL
jgi:glycosyltransferase involved in cell wall biosynthesis